MAKPATQRPKLPSVGRLGLVDPSAPADLDRLGWNTDAHVELLWSLSRAPDADAALHDDGATRRGARAGTGTSSTTRSSRTRPCAAGCSGCSGRRWRWATTSSRIRDRGICWPVTWHCRRRTNCAATFTEAAESVSGTNDALPVAADAVPRPAAGARRAGPGVDRGERAGAAVRRQSASICPISPTPRWPPR